MKLPLNSIFARSARFSLSGSQMTVSKKKIYEILQKLYLNALDETARAQRIKVSEQFVTNVSPYNTDTLIFIDETDRDCRNTIRKHGYEVRGKPVQCQKLLVREESVRGSVNGDIFMDFIQKVLLQCLSAAQPSTVLFCTALYIMWRELI